MKAVIHVNHLGHQQSYGEAIKRGLEKHGIETEIVPAGRPAMGDITVIWGWRRAKTLAPGKLLVMERGYVGDRFEWTSLGWDGLNGRARFPMVDDPARWEKHFAHLMRPTRTIDGYALILGQVEGDAAVQDVNLPQFYRFAADRARKSGMEPVFRPHPDSARRRGVRTMEGARLLEGTLSEALEGASIAVAFNSNSLTDAVLAGVPVAPGDEGAMAWPSLACDRETWARRLAWCQWTMEEIADGTALDYALKAMDGPRWHESFAVREQAA